MAATLKVLGAELSRRSLGSRSDKMSPTSWQSQGSQQRRFSDEPLESQTSISVTVQTLGDQTDAGDVEARHLALSAPARIDLHILCSLQWQGLAGSILPHSCHHP